MKSVLIRGVFRVVRLRTDSMTDQHGEVYRPRSKRGRKSKEFDPLGMIVGLVMALIVFVIKGCSK